MSLVSILTLGFLLGIKHSLEPDHVIAVATTAGNTKKLSRSTLTGVYWGIGHTCTLFLIGMLFIWMKGEIPESLSMTLEFGVGIMLVMLGAKSLFKDRHNITNDKDRFRPFLVSALIGFVHGLAGSAAMVILTMSTVTGIGEGSIYIIIFGAGTIIGMLCFTTITRHTVCFEWKGHRFKPNLHQTGGSYKFCIRTLLYIQIGCNRRLVCALG